MNWLNCTLESALITKKFFLFQHINTVHLSVLRLGGTVPKNVSVQEEKKRTELRRGGRLKASWNSGQRTNARISMVAISTQFRRDTLCRETPLDSWSSYLFSWRCRAQPEMEASLHQTSRCAEGYGSVRSSWDHRTMSSTVVSMVLAAVLRDGAPQNKRWPRRSPRCC